MDKIGLGSIHQCDDLSKDLPSYQQLGTYGCTKLAIQTDIGGVDRLNHLDKWVF